MTLYTICVIINIIAVILDGLFDYLNTGEVTIKYGVIAMVVILVFSGFTGTLILTGLLLLNKVDFFNELSDREITIAKDEFLSGG